MSLIDDFNEASTAPQLSQKQWHSFIEAVANTAIGFLISLFMQVVVIAPLFHLRTNGAEDIAIVLIFTITSILRSYVLRRVFNHWHVKENTK